MKTFKTSLTLIATLAISLTTSGTFSSGAFASGNPNHDLAKNKELARQFFELAFNKHQPEKAAKLYLHDGYIQHNPFAATGSKAFVDFFKDRFKKTPKSRVTIKRLIAEGDLVVIHSHGQETPEDRGRAIIDILRVQDGKFIEHWDVVQPVPEKSANDNTMF